MARLQGFPDSFRLEPTEQHRRYMGNAVPPLLAAAVLDAVVDQADEICVGRARHTLDRALHRSATAGDVSAALDEGSLR